MKFFRWIPFCAAAVVTAGGFYAGGVYDAPPPPKNISAARPAAAPTLAMRPVAPVVETQFVPRAGESLVAQMRAFVFSTDSSEPALERLPALMTVVDKLSAAELAVACNDAVDSGKVEARSSEILDVLLYRWAHLDAGAALDFIVQRHPTSLMGFCQMHPAEGAGYFHRTTGWHPLEAALEHQGELSGLALSYLEVFVAAEAALPSHPSRDAALDRFTAEFNQASLNLSSSDGDLRQQAEATGTKLLASLTTYAQAAGPLVAAARFLTAKHPAPPSPPSNGQNEFGFHFRAVRFTDPVTAQVIAGAFMNVWPREEKAIIAAMRAIPSVQERDAAAKLIAESTGCTLPMGLEKFTLLRQTHSNWQSLEIVPQLIGQSDDSALAGIIDEIPAGPIKDRCLLVLAHKQSWSAPGPALETGLQTTAGPGRDKSLQTIFQRWSESQPAEARAWLDRQNPASTGFLRTPADLPQ